MTITERHEIPQELPPARLYLDDVEDIAALFARATDSEGTPTAVYSAGKFDCTTIEDLKQLGARSARFCIEVRTAGSLVALLRADRFQTFWIYGPAMRKGDAFKVYGQLQAIFEVRKIRWKAALLSMPFWLPTIILLSMFLLAAEEAEASKPSHLGARVLITFALALPLGTWSFYKTIVQHSVVEFCRVHDPHGFRRRFAEWKPYILAAVAGGVITKILDLIANALKR